MSGDGGSWACMFESRLGWLSKGGLKGVRWRECVWNVVYGSVWVVAVVGGGAAGVLVYA